MSTMMFDVWHMLLVEDTAMNVSHPKRWNDSHPLCQPRANRSNLHNYYQRPRRNNELFWVYGNRRSVNLREENCWARAHGALKRLKGRTK